MKKKVLLITLIFLIMAVLSVSAQGIGYDDLFLSPRPGKYADDIKVSLSTDGTGEYQYRFLNSSRSDWVDYRFPLHLTAAPGEERRFVLQVREGGAREIEASEDFREYTFFIDKASPPRPEFFLQGEKNRYYASLSTGEENRIYYWISEFARKEFRRYTGGRIPLRAGALLKAYTIDSVGNHSDVLTESIQPTLKCEYADALEIPSPVEGRFVNPQWFVISNSDCFEWIRYTIDGTDPRYRGANYVDPVLIRMRGDIYLRVAAKPYESDEVMSREIRLVIENPPGGISVPPGERVQELESLPLPEEKSGYEYHYSLEEREVSRGNRVLRKRVNPDVTEGILNYLVYRVGIYHGDSERMYQARSFFIVDRRVPSPPTIEIMGDLPFSRELKIALHSSDDAEIYYSTDGSTPDHFSKKYSGPFFVTPGNPVDIGAISLRTVARYKNGKTSEVSSKLLPFDRQKPFPPDYRVVEQGSGGALFKLNHRESKVDFLYKIVYSETAGIEIDEDSSICGNTLRISFPYGYEGKARIRFAARDRAGNISQPTSIEEIRVDTVPPSPPSIEFSDSQVTILGEGNLFYRLEPVMKEFEVYSEPISFDVGDGEKQEYTLTARAEDMSGNRSRPSVKELVFDRRNASPPRVVGIEDGYSYSEPVVLRVIGATSDVVTYYRLSEIESEDLEDDPDTAPGFSDTVLNEPLAIEGIADSEVEYRLLVRSYLPGSDSWSKTLEYSFTIDRLPPEKEDLSTLIDPGVFNETKVLKKTDFPIGEEVWVHATEEPISLDENKTPRKIREMGTPLSTGVVLRGKEGEEKLYYLYAASFDAAGNAVGSGPFQVMIDMLKPEVPELSGIPEDGVGRDSLTIAAKGDYPHEIVYEITSDFTMPDEPDHDSPKLNLPLTLKREGEGETVFTLVYRGIDHGGNMSEPRAARITMEVVVPAAPEIKVHMITPRLAEVVLKSHDGVELMYSISEQPFQVYRRPFLRTLDTNSNSFTIKAYGITKSRRRGPVATRTIDLKDPITGLITGVDDGKMYNGNIVIRPVRSDIDIRYELREGQQTVPVIGMDSPRMGEELTVKVSEGGEKRFRLALGYVDTMTGRVEHLKYYDFSIDRAPPSEPELVGIEEGAHYTDDRVLKLETQSERSVIYYRTTETPQGAVPFRRYTKPEKIRVRPGVRKDFYLEYWAEDIAGNRSETVNTHFVIDKAGIYVAAGGRDSNSGGKDSPFRSLDRALHEAVETNRNTIYLSRGEYVVSKPVKVGSQLILKGGYKPDDWESRVPERTLISPDTDFPEGSSIFEIRGGTLRLEQILLSNQNLKAPLINQRGEHSNLIVRNSRLVHSNGSLPTLISTEEGNLLFTNSLIDIGPVRDGKILHLSGADISFRECRIIAGNGSGDIVLLNVEKGRIELISSKLAIGNASKTVNLYAEDTDVKIENSIIQQGSGSVTSTGIQQQRGSLTIRNSIVGTTEDNDVSEFLKREIRKDEAAPSPGNPAKARIATGIEVSSSRVELSNTILNTRGENGVVQLSASSGSLVIDGCTLRNGPVEEFSYLVRISGGSCAITNSILETDSAEEVIALDARDRSVLLLRNSDVSVGSGERIAVGIKAGEAVIGTIQGTNLKASNTDESSAVTVGSASGKSELRAPDIGLKLIENSFSGWTWILRTEREKIRTVEELEEERPPFDRKNPHQGNRTQ